MTESIQTLKRMAIVAPSWGDTSRKIAKVKTSFVAFLILVLSSVTNGQFSGSDVAVVKTYSQNGKYFLKSIPYDNEFPTLRGKTTVYATSNRVPLYSFERGFDFVEEGSNNLILSKDGRVIFYAIPSEANELTDGLKSITIYKDGKILRSFTQSEVNGCDPKKERCTLIYQNYDQVVDLDKSNFGTGNYRRVFKDGVNDKEKFLSDFAIFALDDLVYLTDSKKQIHAFDLTSGDLIRSAAFDDIYDEVKTKARPNRTTVTRYEAHIYLEFPRLKDGRNAHAALAAYLGMKPADLIGMQDQNYKLYTVRISLGISRSGFAEIESIDVDPGLRKDRVLDFFKANRFDISEVPSVFEKWYLTEEYLSFRNANDQIARAEKQAETVANVKARQARMTMESIDGVYIPTNLAECFGELDKLVSEIDKKEMKDKPKREDMILYHLTLGMWMRNNWGLHGGSRLLAYFYEKGIRDPEQMSTVVLFYYYDWLTGKKDSWKQWDANPKPPFAKPVDQQFGDAINDRRRP
jgi:hypothetical protein